MCQTTEQYVNGREQDNFENVCERKGHSTAELLKLFNRGIDVAKEFL